MKTLEQIHELLAIAECKPTSVSSIINDCVVDFVRFDVEHIRGKLVAVLVCDCCKPYPHLMFTLNSVLYKIKGTFADAVRNAVLDNKDKTYFEIMSLLNDYYFGTKLKFHRDSNGRTTLDFA